MNVAPLSPRRNTASRSAEAAVDRLRSQTLVGICQAEIERMILDAELGMGARVNELALAARLRISRGPVREACRALTQAGLLETHFNRGFFVRRLDRKEVIDLYDLRAGLMRLAGALAVRTAGEPEVAKLRAQVAQMDEARANGAHARFRALNSEFHAALVQATGNRRLCEMYQGLVKELRLFRRLALDSAESLEQSNREHHAIVEAIAARDEAAAAAAMEDHILRGKARFLAAAGTDVHDGAAQP